jgi:hypothetical protein
MMKNCKRQSSVVPGLAAYIGKSPTDNDYHASGTEAARDVISLQWTMEALVIIAVVLFLTDALLLQK